VECDLAEAYGIHDYTAYTARHIAVLVGGLSDGSRTKMALRGDKLTQDQILTAAIADNVALCRWLLSTDGAKGRNRPASVLAILTDDKKKESDAIAYDTPEDFRMAWAEITGG